MASGSDGSRRYTDEEVRELLERASEMDSRNALPSGSSQGTSLQELESIAQEAGISPHAVRQAARDLEMDSRGATALSRGTAARFLGAPGTVELERTVEGEVQDSALEALIPTIQRAADGVGQPSFLRRTLSWQSNNPQSARTLQISVRVTGGKTHIMLEERYRNLAGGLFGGIISGVGGGIGLPVGLGVGLGALGSTAFAVLFPAAAVGGSYLLARSIFRSFVRKRARILERLLDDLTAQVEDATGQEKGE